MNIFDLDILSIIISLFLNIIGYCIVPIILRIEMENQRLYKMSYLWYDLYVKNSKLRGFK